MDAYCNPDELVPRDFITVVELYSKTETSVSFSEFKGTKWHSHRALCAEGKTEVVMIPAANIIIHQIGEHGELTSKEKAVSLLIEAFDKNGKYILGTRLFREANFLNKK